MSIGGTGYRDTISHDSTSVRLIDSNELLPAGADTIDGNSNNGTVSGTQAKQ